jgi:hypothetical protein
MSKQLVDQKQVFSILQAQLDNQRNQVETSQLMLNEIRSIRDEVNDVKREVGKQYVQMSEMVQEVRDSVTLMNAECDMLHSAVATKSVFLTKDRYTEEDGSFKTVVGIHRRMIWKNLKQLYNVPKYNCIRRIDFESAIQFVRDFKPEAYI